jgi:hypothetical protein
MINVRRVLFPFLLSSLAGVLLGCSGGEPAPPAGDSASELLAEEAAGTEQEALDPTHTTLPRRLDALGNPTTFCTPLAMRDCTHYYKDARGQHCTPSYELCRLDGRNWLPCGEYYVDGDGKVVQVPQ